MGLDELIGAARCPATKVLSSLHSPGSLLLLKASSARFVIKIGSTRRPVDTQNPPHTTPDQHKHPKNYSRGL